MASNYFPANIYYQSLSSGAKALSPYQTIGFPSAGGGLLFRPFSGTQPVSGVTCHAIISVLPTGLVVPPGDYYTDSTTAELITLANT